MAGLETAVEWKVDVVCLHDPPRERAGIGISYSAYDIGRRKILTMAGHTGLLEIRSTPGLSPPDGGAANVALSFCI